MNLIDILNQIYATKNEIRDILKDIKNDIGIDNNIAKYSVAIHNILCDKYNSGYATGYHERLHELTGEDIWPENQRTKQDYVVNDDTNYDPFTLNGLKDIMSDVLGYRINMRDELELGDNNYFPSYPEYLSSALSLIYETAEEQGMTDAEEAVLPAEVPLTPTISFNNNKFSITSSEADVRIYYTIGSSDSTPTLYNSTVTYGSTITVYAYAKRGRVKSEITSKTCTYSASGYQPTSTTKVNPPTFSVVNNVITITPANSQDTIFYSIDGGQTYNLYTAPIQISENTTITAYSVRDNVMSGSTSYEAQYNPEGGSTLMCSFPVYEQNENTISLTCLTSGATIYYKLDDGSYSVYSYPFTITQNCSLYCYATKTGYLNSNVRIYPLIYTVTVVVPDVPQFYMVDETVSGNLHIWTPTSGSYIYYRIGNEGPWEEVQYNHVNVYPTENCIIYAYSVLNGVPSDTAVYNYDYWNKVNNLPTPILEMINNRVYVRMPDGIEVNEIMFTTDGSNPKSGQVYSESYNRSNIVITEDNTVVKVIAVQIDNDNMQHYSAIATQLFSPSYEEDSFDYSSEFFTVKGVSAIYLSDVTTTQNIMNWSYDKVTWNPFNKSVTGLDRDKAVYLKIYGTNSYRQFTTMTFGSGDKVTVSGNIMSMLWADSYLSHNELTYTQSFRRMFYNCTQLVDAKNLVIPVTNSLGSDFYEMFCGCVNLRTAPQKPLVLTELKDYACYGMFSGCTSLVNGLKFTFNKLGVGACYCMFNECSNLMSTGEFIINEIGERSLKEAFRNCTLLPAVRLYINCDMKDESCNSTFLNCASLDSVQNYSSLNTINLINISSENVADSCYYRMFAGCSSLTEFNNLPALKTAQNCYYEMFKGCTSLKTMRGIGFIESVRGRYAMYGMFEGCTSLEKAPAILIHDLDSTFDAYIMHRMFYGCEKLNYIKALFLTDPLISGGGKEYWPFTLDWVYGVADKGTFEQDENATWYRTGVSAIPELWTASATSNVAGHITKIECKYDTVTIECNNENAIYYQINDTGREWILYTGPFEISTDCTIYARCLGNRGNWGEISHQWVAVNVPDLTITGDIDTVSIYAPQDYEYDKIFYKFSYSSNSEFQYLDWILYEGPFKITNTAYVIAYGLKKNGEAGPIKTAIIHLVLAIPTLTCTENVIRIKCEGLYDKIQYSYDGTNWGEYIDPFVIEQDRDIYVRSVKYSSAIHDNEYSEVDVYHCVYMPDGASYFLKYPVFEVKDSSHKNVIICKYNGNTFYLPEGVHVKYRINNGEWQEWIFSGTYATKQITITEDTHIDTYAYDDQTTGDIKGYDFTYDSTQPIITVTPPEIEITYEGTYAIIKIIPSYSGSTSFTKVEGITDNRYANWSAHGDRITLINPGQFVIYAYSEYLGYRSEIVSAQGDSTTAGGVLAKPQINLNPTNNYVIVTLIGTGQIYYSFDNILWQSYSVPLNVYSSTNIWAYCKYQDLVSQKAYKYVQFEQVDPDVLYSPVIFCVNNEISMSCSTPNALIYYRLNGSGDYQLYSSPFEISATTVVEAYSYKNGNQSTTVSKNCEYVPPVQSDDYLRLDVIEGGDIVFGKKGNRNEGNYRLTINYKIDNGEWIEAEIDRNTQPYIHIPVHGGESVYFKADNGTYHVDQTSSSIGFYNQAGYTNAKYNVAGNIMSMIISSNFENLLTLNDELNWGAFYDMFADSGAASVLELRLPATTLSTNCYHGMFKNTTITAAPILPATTLVNKCYSEMFEECTSLTAAPNLPATTLAEGCYDRMFFGCTSLTTAPNLPATTLVKACYYTMFWNCTALLNAPVISATTLAQDCCYGMFYGCRSITTAPALLATTLVEGCYGSMFYGCSSLVSIKCLAINNIDGINTYWWMHNVNSSGTFQKNSAAVWPSGEHGIPSGWTVENA